METLAAYGWRKRVPLSEALFSEGHRFEFLQALRLLETLHPERVPVGEGVEPDREVARFRSGLRFDFPPTEVAHIRSPEGDGPAEMDLDILALAGFQGPLPHWLTELALERSQSKDRALRDFLDLFNHRLISLLYRGKRKYRPALEQKPPDQGRVARSLFSFVGLGTPDLGQRMGLQDRSLLLYTGLMTGRARSMVGLVRMLRHFFGVGVEIQPFGGCWRRLEKDLWTRIGVSGSNQRLGEDVVLGTQIWDQAAGFDLNLGPLSLPEFLAFLPTGSRFRSFCSLVRFYVGEELSFSFRLRLKAAEVPELRLGAAGDSRLGWSSQLADEPGEDEVGRAAGFQARPAQLRLGSSGGARLGWSSWLKTRRFTRDDTQVVLVGIQ